MCLWVNSIKCKTSIGHSSFFCIRKDTTKVSRWQANSSDDPAHIYSSFLGGETSRGILNTRRKVQTSESSLRQRQVTGNTALGVSRLKQGNDGGFNLWCIKILAHTWNFLLKVASRGPVLVAVGRTMALGTVGRLCRVRHQHRAGAKPSPASTVFNHLLLPAILFWEHRPWLSARH